MLDIEIATVRAVREAFQDGSDAAGVEAAAPLDLAAVLSLSLSAAAPVAAIAGIATRPRANRYATNARITSSLEMTCSVNQNTT